MAKKPLSQLVGKLSPQEFEKMAEASKAALGSLEVEYLDVTLEQIATLATQYLALSNETAQQAEEAYRIAHDIKGQGATFGYDVISKIAHSLCLLIRGHEGMSTTAYAKHALAHCEAMKAVIDKRIRGDGGEYGRNLLHILSGRPS